MDTVTVAIIAALTTGVNEVGKKLIVDSYAALKALIKKKFGDQSEVAKAIDNLEAKAESSNRQGTLQEEIVEAKADQDPDILRLAQELLNQLKSQSDNIQHIQSVMGNYNASVQGEGTATVNINQQPKL